MYIANPIYDVVFKFMMDDEKVAKPFLSAIIGEEVLELDFASQERTLRHPTKREEGKKQAGEGETEESLFLTVCRFDFSAKISVPGGGYKIVMIELQKAKLASDIMRFRRYMGLHYQNPANTYGSEKEKKARQIYCIFLLGYDICIPDCPIIQVDYSPKDGITGEELDAKNEFIQSLHHRSWIVQIEQLKRRRRNDVEKLLSIFDQENRTQNHHILNVNEEDFPEMYRPIIRRLRMAYESEDIQMEMELEDDFLKEIQDRERLIAEQEKELMESKKALMKSKKALKEKDKVLKENKKVLKEKDKALEKKDKVLEENKKVLEENKKALEKKDKVLEEKDKVLEEKDKALEENSKLIEALKRQLAENQKEK